MKTWREDRCDVQGLRIEGVSVGGRATNLRVPSLGLLFDIGICQPSCIAGRYHSLLVSHGHSDHAAALVYMLGQRSMQGLGPIDVYLPRELYEPVKALIAVWKDIEGYDRPANFFPVDPGERYTLRSGDQLLALRTVHRVPSLAYLIARKARGENAPFEPLLCVTGDTQIEFILENPIAQQSAVMVHEVTAWTQVRDVERTRARGHTHVDEVLEHESAFAQHRALVLVHRSARHSKREALDIVQRRFPADLRDKVVVFG